LPETKLPETKLPETKLPETKLPETKLPETRQNDPEIFYAIIPKEIKERYGKPSCFVAQFCRT